MEGVEITRVTCFIGNPLAGPNVNLRVITDIIPLQLVGNEMPININFSVASVNSENNADLDNNAISGQLVVISQADIMLDDPG